MKKVLVFLMAMILVSGGTIESVSANTVTMAESNIVYSMEDDYIDLTKISIDIKEDDRYVPFLSSVKNLKEELEEKKITGTGKTAIYFEDDEDFNLNTLRVDLDFTGKTLNQPVNTMFVTDQSGSMNMIAGQTSGAVSATPCLHEEHAYKIPVKIDGVIYNYYHFPSESDWTGDWYDSDTGKPTILGEVKEHAIKEGVATESSTVELKYGNYFPFSITSLSHHYHYDYTGKAIQKNSKRVFIESPVTDEEIEKKELENENFTKIDKDIFKKTASTAVWEFYSPVSIDTSIPAGEYVNNLNSAGECYDRMNISKSVFHELSEIALTNSGNTIGYGNFAGELHSSQSLGKIPLVDEFLNTQGTKYTYYEKGLDFAKDEFTEEGQPHSGNQNLLIFVTDGVPNGIHDTVPELEAYMADFLEKTGAIVYFIGIDIPDVNYNNFGPVIATTDSYGTENMRNSKTPEDLLAIQEELEKILTSTTDIKTQIKEDFYLTVDADHPITVNYIVGDSNEVVTKSVDSMNKLSELGITYNSKTGDVNWDTGVAGITSARLSFYKTFDEETVDWEHIQNGGKLEGTSLGTSTTDYIDYSGRVRDVVMDDTAFYTIEKNSKLRIENTTSTPYNVEHGQAIDYKITVTNTGVLTSDNNFVYQEVPDGAKYATSPKGIYDEQNNLITYQLPELAPGETATMSYTATADSYNFEIVSQAKLGVADEPSTLEDTGVPILTAENLKHKTSGGVWYSTGDSIILIVFCLAIIALSLTGILFILKRQKRAR